MWLIWYKLFDKFLWWGAHTCDHLVWIWVTSLASCVHGCLHAWNEWLRFAGTWEVQCITLLLLLLGRHWCKSKIFCLIMSRQAWKVSKNIGILLLLQVARCSRDSNGCDLIPNYGPITGKRVKRIRCKGWLAHAFGLLLTLARLRHYLQIYARSPCNLHIVRQFRYKLLLLRVVFLGHFWPILFLF